MPELDSFITDKGYFRWREFTRSDTALAHGIDNTPAERSWVWENIGYLVVRVLDPLREALGPIRVTSGYRSALLNRAIGGSPTSFHSFGMAADIRPASASTATVRDLFSFIYRYLPYTELIAEDIPDGWVHVAIEKGRDREKQLKYKLPGGSVKRGEYDQIMRLFK